MMNRTIVRTDAKSMHHACMSASDTTTSDEPDLYKDACELIASFHAIRITFPEGGAIVPCPRERMVFRALPVRRHNECRKDGHSHNDV